VVAIVWQLEARDGVGVDVEQFYGADGEWTTFSRRSRSFLGSSFLKDVAVDTRYLLVEYWSEMVVYERHLKSHNLESRTLDARREELIARIEPLGVFNALDVPDRVGPTWSRRSGK
jgi:hypothetical protein